MAERTLEELAFPYLAEDQIAIIAKAAKPRRCGEGEILFNIGDLTWTFSIFDF